MGPQAAPNPGLASLALIALLLGIAACRKSSPPPPAAPPPIEVDFAGCAAVRAGPVCEVGADPLTLWVKAPGRAAITVQVDGADVVVSRVPMDDGVRLAIPAASVARGRALGVASEAGAFRLELGRPEPVPGLDEAEALRQAQRFDEAEARLRMIAGTASARAQVAGKLARIALAQGKVAAAIDAFHQAIALDREAGRISDEFRDRFALSVVLIDGSHRLQEAREALAPLDALGASYPVGRAEAPYYAGVIAFNVGDLREAIRLLRAANDGARRLGLAEHRVAVLSLEADALHALGRRAEAGARLEEASALLPASADACSRAELLNNLGWFLLDAEPDGAKVRDPIPILEGTLGLLRRDCPRPALLAAVLTNLAHAELARGRTDAARSYLREARASHPEAEVTRAAEWLAIEGRIALRDGNARRALDLFDDLGSLSARALLHEARWQAALGRAQALEALGRAEPALAAYTEAEQILEEDSRLVPLGEGKGTFLGQREESARRLVDFLFRRGSPAAAEAARRSRGRVVGALAWVSHLGALDPDRRAGWEAALADYRREREALDAAPAADWKLPVSRLSAVVADRAAREARLRAALDQALAKLRSGPSNRAPGGALPAPREGEVFLVYHPAPAGWIGFAISTRGTLARRIPEVDPGAPAADLAARLLEPFREAIAPGARLRFLPYGVLARIDFHALPWDGAPLLASFPVAYGVDLPAPTDPPREATFGHEVALIVADPRGNLPAARDEAIAVERVLRARGWTARRIDGEAASHRAVRDAVEDLGTSLLHYAGHGVFEGRDGWESGLPLAAGGWLTVGDVLALRRVPGRVILSGCETARTASETRAEGLGIAQAFILAGARAAVAATRPLDDAFAARLMQAMHEAGSAALDPTAALREAQMSTWKATPAADWASFRVLVP